MYSSWVGIAAFCCKMFIFAFILPENHVQYSISLKKMHQVKDMKKKIVLCIKCVSFWKIGLLKRLKMKNTQNFFSGKNLIKGSMNER